MKKIILTFLLFLSALSVYSQQIFDAKKLDEYFEILDAHQKFMGSVSVSQNGKKIYSTAKGYVDIDEKLQANESTKYKIGSITKTFTAVLIFQAIEDGKLSLEQTLDMYFPEINNADKITIGQMLSHRSGIHNYIDNNYQEWSSDPKSENEMLEMIIKGGSDFKPDSATMYSNSGFVLLSYILEKIHKKSYGKILDKQIIKPLKLKNTCFGSQPHPKKNESRSYVYLDRWRIERDSHPSVLMGAGGIVSTPEDLNLFFEALFTGKLISYQNLEKMRTIRDVFGMGLVQIPFYEKVGYGHTGGIDGFSSVSIYFPSDNLAYSITSNGTNYVLNNITLAVLSAVYNKPFELPDFQRINLSAEEIEPYVGIYSTSQIPIKITITQKENTLIAKASGQPEIALEAVSKNKFVYEKGEIVFEFNPEKDHLIIKQGGGVFLLEKE